MRSFFNIFYELKRQVVSNPEVYSEQYNQTVSTYLASTSTPNATGPSSDHGAGFSDTIKENDWKGADPHDRRQSSRKRTAGSESNETNEFIVLDETDEEREQAEQDADGPPGWFYLFFSFVKKTVV